ncbi:hypothetical protein VRRI112168_02715 [Vreelandella rituensis]|uniref:Uncharacterized protein n=1 Tax=Vreelandella rituensis TaxID=2282306 RepID=A0A368UAL4_9GAMM|nr:hypothetical protein [Halomonas rituensis]RCV93656.1 hypothetical protein DU506_00435 [Halomonas rituensis]
MTLTDQQKAELRLTTDYEWLRGLVEDHLNGMDETMANYAGVEELRAELSEAFHYEAADEDTNIDNHLADNDAALQLIWEDLSDELPESSLTLN